MREWYALAGRRADVWSRQDRLLPPDELFAEDGVLHFLVENQGCTAWGVRLPDLAYDDPPVVVRDEDETWVVQSGRFSEFALHLFAFVVRWGDHVAQMYICARPSCFERIVAGIPELGFPEFVWSRGRLFGYRDLMVSSDDTDHVAASARTAEAMASYRRLLGSGDFEILYEKGSVQDAALPA